MKLRESQVGPVYPVLQSQESVTGLYRPLLVQLFGIHGTGSANRKTVCNLMIYKGLSVNMMSHL